MWSYNYTNAQNELMHHGVQGMHWGKHLPYVLARMRGKGKTKPSSVDSSQNTTSSSKSSATSTSQASKSSSNAKKSISEMSNAEIQAQIDRLRLENTLKSLQPKQVSKGKQFVSYVANKVIMPALADQGQKYINHQLGKLLGNDKKDSTEELLKKLRKSEEVYRLQSKIATHKKTLSKLKEI